MMATSVSVDQASLVQYLGHR